MLSPDEYFDAPFRTFLLGVNYRSPRNIVEQSQLLIRCNSRRVDKPVAAVEGAREAEIRIVDTRSIAERLRLVSGIARQTTYPGRVGVIGRTRSQLIPYEVYYAAGGGEVKTATDLDVFSSMAFDSLLQLLEVWDRARERRRPAKVVEDAMTVFNCIRRAPFGRRDDTNVRRFLRSVGARTCEEALEEFGDFPGPKLRGKSHEHLAGVGLDFLRSGEVWSAVGEIAEEFDGLRFDYEKAEEDIWHTDPPLKQLADMAEGEEMDADSLIERLEAARDQLRHYQAFEDESGHEADGTDSTLHLMTATRAKGKEFDTVIVLDAVETAWPHKRAESEAEIEAERRLFYVAFTRARRRVILLTAEGAPPSRFLEEAGL